MTPAVVVVSLVAVFLAFRAGSSWKHHMTTWNNHKVAAAATKKLRRSRWTVLKLALLAVVALVLYEGAVTVAAAVSGAGDFLRTPPHPTQSTAVHPSPSQPSTASR